MAKSTAVEDLGPPLKFDPQFNGPLKNRSCTDIICLLLFLVFIVVWIGLGVIGISKGDPQLLLAPKDSNGRRCGMDEGVTDKPYLFFFDLTACLVPSIPPKCQTPQICVSKCPNDNYVKNNYGKLDPEYIYNSMEPNWYMKSHPVQDRCIPYLEEFKNIENFLTDVNIDKLHTAVKNIKLLSDSEQFGQVVVKDIIYSWWKILIGAGGAVLVCLLYVFMLRFIAGIMVWISIFGIVALTSAGVYFTQKMYREALEKSTGNEGIITEKHLWLLGLIVLSVVLVIILLVIIFLRKRIVLAIALIKESSKAVSSVTSIFIFPLIPWILQAGVFAYALIVGLYLATTGNPIYKYKDMGSTKCPHIGQPCAPNTTTSMECSCDFVGTETTSYYTYMQVFNLFGFFWLIFSASAFGQMVLAGVFSQWYWTFKKRNLPFFAVSSATYRTLRYHVGTLAFGSLIIAICRMIRVFLEYLDHKLKKYDNALTRAILCCLKCFFWCLEKFLKFINKNAYIMCAIHGKNFCTSAKDAFGLLMRNILRVFVLDKVTDFLFFLSKLLITLGVGSVAYVFFATDLTGIDNSNITYGLVPVIVIMIITYLITIVFFNVYSMAVDTLFLCFLEDCERNDGSPEKPYFMSKSLMNVLGKKNKHQ
ncbi:choline transporter-like 2 isoform X2 [Aethina tumida]|uniref:choline transporter-like 2 isoform X2 n=1 Tax=Aethina tumida TaxID=116153 RepID=UPI002148236A|nr:choline transporter-like 2 isoform X2 [Aethina tumida]